MSLIMFWFVLLFCILICKNVLLVPFIECVLIYPVFAKLVQ